MKPKSYSSSLRNLIVSATPLLLLSPASAEILNFNEANTTGVWTLPPGTNLLNAAAATPVSATVHEGSSPAWSTLTDGILATPGNKVQTVTPSNGETVTFPLDVVAQPGGYTVTTFDAYCTWTDGGRSDMHFTLQYSTVADPTNFVTLAVVANAADPRSSHTSLTDTSGVLATGVHSVRILFGNPTGQENTFVGYTEFKMTSVPTNVQTLVEANTGNGWTLPVGTNLLSGANAVPATLGIHEGSSSAWTTATDGLLGSPTGLAASVTPSNHTSVVFPLDLSVNYNGYALSSFDSYCAWGDNGRNDQDLSISYSTVADPDNFIRIGTAVARDSTGNATHVRLTPASGTLARNVAAVRLDFGKQENTYTGYREFIALGTAEPTSDPLTWTGGSGSAGNANWISGPDSNWKKTSGGAAANFNPIAALSFDSTGNNRNITLPSPLTAASLTFSNVAGAPYNFGGGLLTVDSGITFTGSGGATFANAVHAGSDVVLSGDGALTFNGTLAADNLTLSGSGTLTLGAANPALTGAVAISDGTLSITHNAALQNAHLAGSGGAVRFLTGAPQLGSLAGAFNTSVVLGNATGPVNPNLSIGDGSSATSFEGEISQAAGTTGSLTKTGNSSLTLAGINTYSGTTTASGGLLEFARREALYNGSTGSWTAAKLIATNGGTMSFQTGIGGQFSEAELNEDIALGGFQAGSAFGISNTGDFTLSRSLTRPGMGFYKSGTGSLAMTGVNTSDGSIRIAAGTLYAASTSGASLGGNVVLGNATSDVCLIFGADNQFAAGRTISAQNGNVFQSKVNLRGTDQTVGGLDAAPFPANRVTLVQADETGQPGYAGAPGPSVLTIDATADHSFAGIIRNGSGGDMVSLVKTGTGTQEFINLQGIEGYNYTGTTSILEGALRLKFSGGNTAITSDFTVSSPGALEFDGTFTFARTIAGTGEVVKRGSGTVTLSNAAFTHTGTLRVNEGTLQVNLPALANASSVVIADGAVLNLPHADVDTVAALTLGVAVMPDGVYAAMGNGGTGITETARISGTGRLRVFSGTEVTYEAWSAIIPNAADRDRGDDPDGDGFTNEEEFLFGTSPVAGNGSLASFEKTPGGLLIRWNQRTTGSSVYALRESTTLLTGQWQPSTAIITNAAVQDLPDYVKKEALIPLVGARKFVRVEATE